MSAAAHTPTPWHAPAPWAGYSEIRGADGKLVFGIAAGAFHERQTPEVCRGNLDFILRACNAHEALVEALTCLHRYHTDPEWASREEEIARRVTADNVSALDCLIGQAETSLALAKAQP